MIAPSRRGLLLGLWRGDPEDPLPRERRVAWIDPRACLWRTGCGTCAERCPERGAIELDGPPTVQSDLCTGCGRCVELCPAPATAIYLLARRDAA